MKTVADAELKRVGRLRRVPTGGPARLRRPRPVPGRGGCGRDQDRNLWFWVFVGPFVLGLLVFVYVPIAWSLYLSFFDAYNTVTPSTFVGLRNYGDMLSDPRVPLEPARRSSSFAVFIVPTTFVAVARAGAAGAPGAASCRRSSARSSSCRRPAPTSWRRWSGRCRSSPASASGWPTPSSAGSAIEPVAWLSVAQPPWYWLVHRHRAAVAAGRVLHDPLPRRAAADPADAVRGGGGGRRPARLAGVPLHHLPAAARDLGRRCCCCC